MERDVTSNVDSEDVKDSESISSSDNIKDSFNMKSGKDSLPTHEGESSSKVIESEEEEYSDAKDNSEDSDEELDMDDEWISESHKDLSEEQLQDLKDKAITLKSDGNESFKKTEYKDSIAWYTKALNICPLKYQSDRSVLYANRAAARISLDKKEDAVLDCNKAIELNPNYLKAILRRAQLHQKMDNLERSLEDYQKVLELDCNNAEARQSCATLPAIINEKNEKLKDEMFGKLKELGNMCLKPFGLSTNNFNVVQDPNTGGYSVNFQNNPT